MERSGYVSLWVGTFPSVDKLQAFLREEFTEDGDALPSMFMTVFAVDRHDPGFREAHRHNHSTQFLRKLLEGCSYDDEVIPRFEERVGHTLSGKFNSILLLYEFEYNGAVNRFCDGDTELVFVGAARFR